MKKTIISILAAAMVMNPMTYGHCTLRVEQNMPETAVLVPVVETKKDEPAPNNANQRATAAVPKPPKTVQEQPEETKLSKAEEYRRYVESRTEEILAEEAAARGIDVELCRELNAVADPVIIEGLERGDDHDTIQAAVDEAINAYWWWKELEAWAQTADQDMAEFARAAEAYGGQAFVDEESYAAENDLTIEQYDVVKPIIQSIAADALGTGSTDLEHVRAASKAIYNDYVVNAVYGDEGDSYNSPYGLLVEGQYTCAGTAKTMAMVLYEMGYPVTYYNEGLNEHQWVETVLDGQPGWAECMGGIADYGEYPFPCYNPEGTYTDPETGDVWQLGGYN